MQELVWDVVEYLAEPHWQCALKWSLPASYSLQINEKMFLYDISFCVVRTSTWASINWYMNCLWKRQKSLSCEISVGEVRQFQINNFAVHPYNTASVHQITYQRTTLPAKKLRETHNSELHFTSHPPSPSRTLSGQFSHSKRTCDFRTQKRFLIAQKWLYIT